MVVADIVIPCLSVFSLAAAEVAPVADIVPEPEAPIVLAMNSDAEALDFKQEEVSTSDAAAGMEAPYTAEIQPPTVETTVTEELEFPEEMAGPPVFADKTDDEVFQLVADYLQGISTMTADFIQTAPSGNVTTGTLQLSRPGRLRFDYDEPNPTLIVATQGLVYVHDTDLETTDSYPVNKTPLKFLLNRKVRTEDAVLQEVLRDTASVNLVLQSDDPETEGQLIMVFAAPELTLRRWVVIDGAGNYTIVELDNVEQGVRIANRAFRIPEAGSSFTRDR